MRVRALCLAFLVATAIPIAGCDQLFSKPTVSVERVDLTAVSFQGISANFVFKIENHNAIGIDLAKLVYQLTVDNHPFVQGAANNPLHVPAQGVGQLTLPVSFKFIELAEALASLFTKRAGAVHHRDAARLRHAARRLHGADSHTGTMPVPQLPSLSIGNAAVGGVNVSGATLSVTIAVHNNNTFALPVGALQYALSINGASLAVGDDAAGAAGGERHDAADDQRAHRLSARRARHPARHPIALGDRRARRQLRSLGYAMPVHLSHAIR